MVKANDNMKYELKRFTYTIQKSKRDDIMKDISRINALLRDTLSDQDRISQEDDYALGLTRRTVPRQYKKLLRFWKHADSIYRLMQAAWHVCSLALCLSALGSVQRTHGYRSRYARQLLSQWSVPGTTTMGQVLALCDLFRSPTTTTVIAITEKPSSLSSIRPVICRKRQ
jgi:hypothetical protein